MSDRISFGKELPAIAAERLRKMIIDKNMRPGDRFPSESELIDLYGVSRSTIREAIKLLVAENVVEIRRGRGTFITRKPGLSKDPLGLHFTDQHKLLQNLLETRKIIEPPIAYLAAQRATERDIHMLEQVIDKMQNAPDPKAVHAQLDIQFHSIVAQCTQNEVLHRFLPIICESIREGYYETVTIKGSQQRAMDSHIKILDAIKHRLPDVAKRETEQHIVLTANDAKLNLGGKLNEKDS